MFWAILITGLLGLMFILLGVARLRRRRLFAAGRNGLAGGMFLAVAGLLFAVSMNLHTYHRLSYEREVAELRFSRLNEGLYELHLKTADGHTRLIEINGDEWQLDARVIKWKGLANILGLDAQYRLERISGRYRDIARERSGPRSAHALGEAAGLDLWAFMRRHPRWVPWADAVYGSATYLPMDDKAAYSVHITQSGLVARPGNAEAEAAVSTWQ